MIAAPRIVDTAAQPTAVPALSRAPSRTKGTDLAGCAGDRHRTGRAPLGTEPSPSSPASSRSSSCRWASINSCIVLEVYPPWGEPMPQPELNLLALTYRIVITIGAAWLTARLAPHRSAASDWRHVWVFGAIGLVLGTIGAITMIPKNFGPAWYPILLAASSLPCAWLGGKPGAPRVRPAAEPV
jgi:hypothetical protein